MPTDFFGEEIGVDPMAAPSGAYQPLPRATTPDGMRYLDTGEPTDLAIRRQRASSPLAPNMSLEERNQMIQAENDRLYQPDDPRDNPSGVPVGMKWDPVKGQWYYGDNRQAGGGFLDPRGDTGGRMYISNDPQANVRQSQLPMFSVQAGALPSSSYQQTQGTRSPFGANGVPLTLMAGDPSQQITGQRSGTAAEAAVGNANYAATGRSSVSPDGSRNVYTQQPMGDLGSFGQPITRPDQFESSAPIVQPLSQAQPISRPGQYRTDQVMQQLNALFAAEQNQGPSEAEALLQQATDRAAGQALGIAAGARGGAGARARAQNQALAANAAMGSQASQDIAALRAREENDRRARQAQIMGMLSGAAQGIDARDLGYAQAELERQTSADRLGFDYSNAEQARRDTLDQLGLGYTQAESAAEQARASLANTAYQQGADRELRRAEFNAQQPVGFMEDPASAIFERLFGGPLRSGARV